MYYLYLLVFIFYGIGILFILLFSFSQLALLINYFLKKNPVEKNKTPLSFPMVTIQLPVYNEKYVITQLLSCIEEINYPLDKLQVQLLDDSTDESLEIASKKIAEMQKKGFPIEHIIRTNRTGYKAGALKEGLNTAKGEFVAIFDADFLPHKNFLLDVLPYFINKSVGLVQTAWKYTNENYSLLTILQSFGLNAHFTIEQTARNTANYFINFNGTAGIWRKQCILDAGNWQSDTLTEDLDLSYRAQLKKWKFVYAGNIECLSELPVTVTALKSQQFRWSKGAAQCAKKNLFSVWKSHSCSFTTKLMATFHLMNSCIFPAILCIALLTLPLLYIKQNTHSFDFLFRISPLFSISIGIVFALYAASFFKNQKTKFQALLLFPFYFLSFLSISMALSIHNSLAVFEGLLGIKSEFIRTPKFNLQNHAHKFSVNKYATKKWSVLTWVELAFAFYFLISAYYCYHANGYGAIPFMCMISIGLIYLLGTTLFPAFKYKN